MFAYRSADRELDASGDRIDTRTSELGTEISAVLEVVPDDRAVTLTLLVPTVNVANGSEGDVTTTLVETTTRTSIGGPGIVEGQLQTYRVTELTGTARFVVF